ncbi:hypothetical protein K435DRAFT_858741 [Dendrothele bispora CBS 962.96]|uniref:Uncharacterized protein n=1 Tax=Dendrothele bispora (strain CBS 962.96) TaxID=1314807 RepID=A0A4S8M2C3_DENBC|nr:hypothetical protein K435DRAFT_858741 [Dendrothele bispora CBS 962.96]
MHYMTIRSAFSTNNPTLPDSDDTLYTFAGKRILSSIFFYTTTKSFLETFCSMDFFVSLHSRCRTVVAPASRKPSPSTSTSNSPKYSRHSLAKLPYDEKARSSTSKTFFTEKVPREGMRRLEERDWEGLDLSGAHQTSPIKQLSDEMRNRVVFVQLDEGS